MPSFGMEESESEPSEKTVTSVRNYRIRRVQDYIDSIDLVAGSHTDFTTRSSCPSLSTVHDMAPSQLPETQNRTPRASQETKYKFGLSSRHVDMFPQVVRSYARPEFLNDDAVRLPIPESVDSSLNLAFTLKDLDLNDSTYGLVIHFFIAEWLVGMSNLRFAQLTQWQTERLENFGDAVRPLSMPTPSLTIGFSRNSLFQYQDRLPVSPTTQWAFPIPDDFDTTLPFFAVEVKCFDSAQACLQNLHTAALMLRGLRRFFEKCHGSTDNFDGKVRVLTATISRHEVKVYGHWTLCGSDSSRVWYEHFLLHSWFLRDREDFYRARKGLEALCNWMAEENQAWISPGME